MQDVQGGHMGATLVAEGTFAVDTWEPGESRTHGAAELAGAQLAKTFSGDITGTSRVQMLGVTAADEQARAYVALEELDVTVDGRAGTFVLVHVGIDGGANDGAAWTIAPGTGSGELEGIAGTAQLVREEDGTHRIRLEYSLGPEA